MCIEISLFLASPTILQTQNREVDLLSPYLFGGAVSNKNIACFSSSTSWKCITLSRCSMNMKKRLHHEAWTPEWAQCGLVRATRHAGMCTSSGDYFLKRQACILTTAMRRLTLNQRFVLNGKKNILNEGTAQPPDQQRKSKYQRILITPPSLSYSKRFLSVSVSVFIFKKNRTI